MISNAIRRLALLPLILVFSLSGQPPAQPQGSHRVHNLKYDLLLRPQDASRKDGTPIVLYGEQPWKCMAWRFEPLPDGVRLVNYFTNKTFEKGSGSGPSPLLQTPVGEAREQAWKFVTVGNGVYRIESAAGGGVLTAVGREGDGDIRVVVAPWTGSDAQKWQLLDLPPKFTM